jgi:hypothetical protein
MSGCRKLSNPGQLPVGHIRKLLLVRSTIRKRGDANSLKLQPNSWCPGWDLNPHTPYGIRDFKCCKFTITSLDTVVSLCCVASLCRSR